MSIFLFNFFQPQKVAKSASIKLVLNNTNFVLHVNNLLHLSSNIAFLLLAVGILRMWQQKKWGAGQSPANILNLKNLFLTKCSCLGIN